MGGMNVADDDLQGGVTRKGWHDTDILVKGPAAAEAQKAFLELWELSRCLASPAPSPPFPEQEAKAIQEVFYEDHGRFQVKLPAEAGKRVVLVTSPERSHDIGTIPWKAGTSHHGKLLDAGAFLFEWQGHADVLAIDKANGCTIPDGAWPGRTIHSRVAVIDGQVCLVGSHSFNVRRESFNNESATLFQDQRIGRRLVKVFVDDLGLAAKARTVPCGAAVLPRPRRVIRIFPADAGRFEREHGGTARLLSGLQTYLQDQERRPRGGLLSPTERPTPSPRRRPRPAGRAPSCRGARRGSRPSCSLEGR